jgi:uncharacterized protein (TIGR02145 family)
MKKLTLILSAVLMATMIVISCGGGGSNEIESSNKTESSNEVTIGKQVWMTQNLNVDKFRNGDPIPEAKTAEDWKKAGENREPAWCYYNNNPDNGDRYGKLYNWFAVNDPRGLAPKDWKIPSDEDWNRLIDFLGGKNSEAEKKMKFTDFWANNNDESGNGNNTSGFSGLPGGFRNYANGPFVYLGDYGCWWSSSEHDAERAGFLTLPYDVGIASNNADDKREGFSVRCLRN